jgi:hypothetical protein
MIVAAGMAAVMCGDDNNNPAGPSNTGPIVFTAQLSAANEIPTVTNAESSARGTSTVTMNVPRDATGAPSGPGTVTMTAVLNSFPPNTPLILGHIHTGAAGATGSPVVNTGLSAANPLVMGDGTINTTFSNLEVSAANAQAIYNNPAGHYVNYHTASNPSGAVRGQLVRQ